MTLFLNKRENLISHYVPKFFFFQLTMISLRGCVCIPKASFEKEKIISSCRINYVLFFIHFQIPVTETHFKRFIVLAREASKIRSQRGHKPIPHTWTLTLPFYFFDDIPSHFQIRTWHAYQHLLLDLVIHC